MKALLLCAGLGTRLKPLTNKKPKALVELAGKSLLQWNIEKLIFHGYKQIVINVHHFADQIINFLKSNDNFGIDIQISDERDTLRDTGGGLRHARQFLEGEEHFLIHNVDIITNLDLVEMLELHKDRGAMSTLAVRSRKTSRYLTFEDGSSEMTGWTNIKTNEIKISRISSELVTNFAFSGVHMVNSDIFELLPDEKVFSIIDAYLDIAKNNKVICFPHDASYWHDVGKAENIPAAERSLNKIKSL